MISWLNWKRRSMSWKNIKKVGGREPRMWGTRRIRWRRNGKGLRKKMRIWESWSSWRIDRSRISRMSTRKTGKPLRSIRETTRIWGINSSRETSKWRKWSRLSSCSRMRRIDWRRSWINSTERMINSLVTRILVRRSNTIWRSKRKTINCEKKTSVCKKTWDARLNALPTGIPMEHPKLLAMKKKLLRKMTSRNSKGKPELPRNHQQTRWPSPLSTQSHEDAWSPRRDAWEDPTTSRHR